MRIFGIRRIDILCYVLVRMLALYRLIVTPRHAEAQRRLLLGFFLVTPRHAVAQRRLFRLGIFSPLVSP